MNTTILCFLLPLMVMLALFFRVLKANSPQSPFIRTLREAGIRPGETEHLIAGGVFLARQAHLMTDREVNFIQGLFRTVDMNRWYLCPQVRVADIVQIAPRIRARSRAWWKLFSLVSRWHCDVVIVDRLTFRIVAALELDDASHLKKSRRRRDILLNEVMRQAGIPLLRSRDSQALQTMTAEFLALQSTGDCPRS